MSPLKVESIAKKSQHGDNFSIQEDNLLVSAFLNVNQDVEQREIHVFVEHPVHEPLELPDSELEGVGVDAKALEVFVSDSVLQNDHYYEYGDKEYRPDFSQFGGHDNAEFTNVDHGEPREVDAEQVCARKAGKALVVDDQVEESSEGSEDERSDLEEEPEIQPMNIAEDSTDSWDNQAKDDEVEPGQMGGGVMNSDYESEELLSLDKSSSSSENGDDSSDDDILITEVDNSIRRSKYPIFRPVAKAEHLRFKKDMLFISTKQFKDAITDYAVDGGSYRNPRCTTSYIGKKLVNRVRRQPDIKFKDIQDAVHEKYMVNISVGKTSRAREKAQDAVDGAHTAQFNQLWEYCDELRRCSPGSTVLMKVHTFNDGDLAAKTTYIDCYEPIIEPINGQNMWRPSGLPLVQLLIKRRPPGRPKKKRALEPDEPRSHRKKRVLGISKQCKLCGKLGHNKRSCKGEVGGNSSLPRSASQASRTTRRAAKDGHANSPAVGSAQPAKDVTTSAPPPPTDNQSNPRPKRQRKKSAVTIETLNATGIY
nr:hypothetical protein CFP56_08649 [Quercus suber]